MKTSTLAARTDARATAARRLHSRVVSGALVLLLSGFLTVSESAASEPDPYLQAINAEGNRLESLGKAKQEQDELLRQHATEKSPATAKVSTAPAPKSAPTLNMQGFEGSLRQNFPGSFALYSLMDPHEKDEVYAEYQKKKGEGNARFIPVVVKIIAITNANTRNRERAQNK